MSSSNQKAILISVSGPSSSGKTTLARLIHALLPSSLLVHEDDFYKPEDQIPKVDGLTDWDCPEAIDTSALLDALRHIKETGLMKDGFESKEPEESGNSHDVSKEEMSSLRQEVETWMKETHAILKDKKLVVVDGFLLYPECVTQVRATIDIKLFITATHDVAKNRRESRPGYATLEGWWADPPGYVDKIVWPNYVKHHSFLFENGDVDGRVDSEVLRGLNIVATTGNGEISIAGNLKWALSQIEAGIRGL